MFEFRFVRVEIREGEVGKMLISLENAGATSERSSYRAQYTNNNFDTLLLLVFYRIWEVKTHFK